MRAKKNKFLRKAKSILLSGLFLIFLLAAAFSIYNFFFLGLIYPNTTVAGVFLSGRKIEEAIKILNENIKPPSEITLVWGEKTFSIDLGELGFNYDLTASAQEAFNLTRTGHIFPDFYKRFLSLFEKTDTGLKFSLDKAKLEEAFSVIDAQISVPAVYPSLKLKKGEVFVEKGKPGTDLDRNKVSLEIYDRLAKADSSPVAISVKTTDPSISGTEAEALKLRAEKIAAKSLVFKFEFQEFIFSGDKLLAFLDPRSGSYDQKAIEEALGEVGGGVNRPPQDPVFAFEDGRVKEFTPAKDGITLKEDTFREMLVGNLTTLEVADTAQIVVDLPVTKIPSKIKTEEVNNLGIKELIGRGSSRFVHSIPNRIHNIGLASSRFKGVLIPPGEVFSFNDVLGDVSSYTGYKQAFVIKDGKTVLGDGGGVCQVSTTFFRAALDAGLPIIERKAHSYRVGYYEQDSPPGFDATVFAPSSDLKVKNDTPGYILIQPIFDAKNQTLVFEFYGTKDGRVATTTKPKISSVTPPPPDLYVDDPTLPAGTIKQIDFRAAGAKVSFSYKVSKGGEEIYSNTFVSNYRPWQAVYLRGTGL